jgi:glucose/arabinose dehydrogenase
MSRGFGPILIGVAMILGAAAYGEAQAPRSPTPTPIPGGVRVETVARGLEHPWGLAFVPDGRMLVTERPGRLRLVGKDGRISAPLAGLPAVQARGQGGLLDVALDPRFTETRLLYLSYAEPGDGGTAGTAVARGRLGEGGIEDVRVIYRQRPKVAGSNHFGSRLVFARDGALFITQGDRYAYRDAAQDLASGLGKVVRLQPDGTVPTDNPFVGRAGVLPEIWSVGHRNVQGATLHPETGRLWIVELEGQPPDRLPPAGAAGAAAPGRGARGAGRALPRRPRRTDPRCPARAGRPPVSADRQRRRADPAGGAGRALNTEQDRSRGFLCP